MAADRWIAANIAGTDYLFRTDEALEESVPAVFLARKLTLLVPARGPDGKAGVLPKKIGDRRVNGAHLVLWTEATPGDRAALVTIWKDEIAVAGRPAMSLVGKE